MGSTLIGLALLAAGSPSPAAEKIIGVSKCAECHKKEHEVWKHTRHFKGFRDIEKNPLTAPLLKAVAAPAPSKKAAACALCHFTVSEGVAKSGVSCESCHGAAGRWLTIHNDYGGTCEKESDAHRAKRLASAAAAGMRTSSMHYEIAANCLGCHGLGHAELPADTLTKLLEAGHPLSAEFEFVRYSQGTVRHRFYPVPTGAENKAMTPAELARFLIIGAAAQLVNAAQPRSNHPKYQAAAGARTARAKAVLEKVALPEAAALLKAPTEAAGKALAAAIKDKDLSASVAGLLPAPATYK